MNWAKIFDITAKITSAFSLAAFLGALIIWFASRKRELSILERVKGQGIVNAETTIKILQQFRSDEHRIQALEKVLGYDRARAKGILERVRPQIDVGKFSLSEQREWRRGLLSAGIVLLVLAVIALLSSLQNPKDSGSTRPEPGLPPLSAAAEPPKCPKGYQPYGERCVTQRMADYVSCIEASGGNRQELSDEVTAVANKQASGGGTAGAKGAVISGQVGLVLNKESEDELKKRIQSKWYSGGMGECTKVLNYIPKRTRVGSGADSQPDPQLARSAYEQQFKEINQQFEVLDNNFFRSHSSSRGSDKEIFRLKTEMSSILNKLHSPVISSGAGLLTRQEWNDLRENLKEFGSLLHDLGYDYPGYDPIQERDKSEWVEKYKIRADSVEEKLRNGPGQKILQIVETNKR